VALLAGCTNLDLTLNDYSGRNDAGPQSMDDSGLPVSGAGGGGAGGTGGTEDAGRDAGPVPPEGCQPNPDPEDEVCPEICPELCNGEDDDCDTRIDEGTQGSCVLPNAAASCGADGCQVDSCNTLFADCDLDTLNGCEVDLRSDASHCGLCGTVCTAPNAQTQCLEGLCTVVGCMAGHADCDGSSNTCETPLDTPFDCGSCGTSCSDPDHAEAGCVEGDCGVGRCVGNFGDCNDTPADGCETVLDVQGNCGACGVTCDFAGSSAVCNAGVCQAGSCGSGYGDCDGDDSNGCEPLDSAQHCGACNAPCLPASLDHVQTASCQSNSCEITCKSGYGDCDANPSNGCETSLNDNLNCGGCDVACSFPSGIGDCSTGTCTFDGCTDGWANCKNGTGDGCETHVSSDDANCNGCNIACTNGKTCMGGVCTDAACTLPLAACTGTACTTNLSLVGSCGACGNVCAFDAGVTPHGTLTCPQTSATPGSEAWGCSVSCAAGWSNCDGNYKNGCETDLRTLSNCGACGQGCSIPNAGETCQNLTCQVLSCDADWGNCDANPNTCETALNTINNCGACATSCSFPNASASCGGSPGARSCQFGSCSDAINKNCDNNTVNGCETNTNTSASHCGACGLVCADLAHVNTGTCQTGGCQITACDTGWGDCSALSGCETDLTRTQTCGGCNTDCDATLPHTATTTCGAGQTCQVASCDSGYANCGAGAGCETDIFADAANCGGCSGGAGHTPCQNLPHVDQSSCMAGSCMLDLCDAGYEDCNGVLADGCEWQPAVSGACCTDHTDPDGDGTDNCSDLCPNDPARIAPGDCGCANAPQPAATACDDGACAQNVACNGAATCGYTYDCGLLGHWKLDETSGSSAADSSGAGHTGTLLNVTGTPWIAGAPVNGALHLDGSDDALDVGQVPVSGAITIAAWIRTTTLSGRRSIVQKRDNAQTNRSAYGLEKNEDSGELWFSFNANNTWYVWGSTSTTLITTNTWMHVAATYDASGPPKLYKNGAAVTVSQDFGSGNPARPTNTANTVIGDLANPAAALPYNWSGDLDDVRIYNRVLTAAEIAALAAL
jgi:hypothetical protein